MVISWLASQAFARGAYTLCNNKTSRNSIDDQVLCTYAIIVSQSAQCTIVWDTWCGLTVLSNIVTLRIQCAEGFALKCIIFVLVTIHYTSWILIIIVGKFPYNRRLHCACSTLNFLVDSVHVLLARRHGVVKRLATMDRDDFRSSELAQR